MLDRLWLKALIETARAQLWEGRGAETTVTLLIKEAGLRAPRTEAERLLLLGIVADLHAKARGNRASEDPLHAAAVYIRANCRSGRLTRAKVAKGIGVSESWLAHTFKKTLGSSFPQFVTEQRLNVAAELLRSTTKSVKEIALTTGFRSAVAFVRSFTARFGIPPGEWRKAHPAPRTQHPAPSTQH